MFSLHKFYLPPHAAFLYSRAEQTVFFLFGCVAPIARIANQVPLCQKGGGGGGGKVSLHRVEVFDPLLPLSLYSPIHCGTQIDSTTSTSVFTQGKKQGIFCILRHIYTPSTYVVSYFCPSNSSML